MPTTSQSDRKTALIRTRWDGPVTLDDVLAHFESLAVAEASLASVRRAAGPS